MDERLENLSEEQLNHLAFWGFKTLAEFEAWALKHPLCVLADKTDSAIADELGIWDAIVALCVAERGASILANTGISNIQHGISNNQV